MHRFFLLQRVCVCTGGKWGRRLGHCSALVMQDYHIVEKERGWVTGLNYDEDCSIMQYVLL